MAVGDARLVTIIQRITNRSSIEFRAADADGCVVLRWRLRTENAQWPFVSSLSWRVSTGYGAETECYRARVSLQCSVPGQGPPVDARTSSWLLACHCLWCRLAATGATWARLARLGCIAGCSAHGSVAPGDNFTDRDRVSRCHHQDRSVTRGPTTRPALSSPAYTPRPSCLARR